MPRISLPAQLGDAFLVSTATDLGVSTSRLRGPDLCRPTRGVRTVMPSQDDDLALRLRGVQLVLPRHLAFSHVTAARWLGLPLPTAWTPDEPLHVTSALAKNPIRRRGLVTHTKLDVTPTEFRGVRIVSSRDAWIQCGTLLDLEAMVVMADSMCFGSPGRLAQLQAAVKAHSGRAGADFLRRAVAAVRCGSASPRETQFRLLLGQAGLPEPRLNVDIHDGSGGWLARPDFVWADRHTGLRLAVEYDGNHHRTQQRQWSRDNPRDLALREEGWTLIVLTNADFLRPGPVLELLASYLGVQHHHAP